MTLTKITVVPGELARASDFNSIQTNDGKEMQPKTLAITGTDFAGNGGTGYVSWTAGVIYYDGSAFTLSAGNSAADWRDKFIVATLSGGTATISGIANSSRIQDETKILIGYEETSGVIRMYVSQEVLEVLHPFVIAGWANEV